MIYNLKDAVITLKDGTPTTPKTLEIVADEGDLSFSESREINPIMDRGSLALIREGNETMVDVSFSIKYSGLLGSATPTVYEALKKQGTGGSTWQSTNADSEVYTVDIEFEVSDPSTGSPVEVIRISKFAYEKIEFKEGEEYDTLSVSGKAFAVTVAAS
ncbi:MAG: hypothetical protein AMQ22_00238 [Candidatus Methanofastidiosum methylothiophilum]|uniref:Phage major tail protein 2 n=1 Tax=Candidatus Methanofastidiosum methylothiophilum TaxID=1705564 RepID=A0A150ISD0_9EURY|nr:MAG: hypothetical protein APG11_00807 [Candidatus Methanofastidiosum methylthiophilus]KYC53567.1 MAG: hypothetical protein AMQ22_00238 [Candidatus Methanofastidiosum methylthiophilus]